jgi:large repetitive protein
MSDPVFNYALTNPFGLTNAGFLNGVSKPTFVDINGDGNLDAFVGNISGSTLLFKNTGTNTAPAFAAATSNPFLLTSVGANSSPTFIDVDGDGKLDALIGNSAGNTLFFKNTGTTTAPAFAAAMTNPFNLTNVGGDSSPTFADIDGDGKLDALIGNSAGGTAVLRFFKNTSTTSVPAFAAAITSPFGLGMTSSLGIYIKPTVVDIDGDGKLDILIGNSSGNTLFFRNTGTTTNPAFAAVVNNPFDLTDVGDRSTPTFVDINGDGNLDALIGNLKGDTLFFRNVKPPEISSSRYDVNSGNLVVFGAGFPALAGANNDIDVSKLTITGENGNSYTLTSGAVEITDSHSFTVTLNAVDKAAVSLIINKKGNQSNGGTIYNLAAAEDWTAGSDPALVVALAVNSITAVADPVFVTPTTNPYDLTNVGKNSIPSLVDIDGDGKIDAFIGNFDGNTLFFKNTGTTLVPAFAPAETNPFGLIDVGVNSNPTFVDIDDDGKLDALIGNGNGNILFFKNTGTTLAPAFVTNPFGLSNIGGISNPTFVDIDGNGTLDAFVDNSVGQTLFFNNTGTTTNPAFAAVVTSPFGLTFVANQTKLTFVDIDGNGTLDALFGNVDGNTRFYRNTGTTTNPAFAAAVTNPFNLTDVGDYSSPIFVDINGDGNLDAFVGNSAGNTLFFNNTLPPTTITRTRNDFNGDGKSDILWRNDYGSLALWQMNGTTVANAALTSTSSIDSSWKNAGTGDFNGDGKTDILWRNDNGAVDIWTMNGSNVLSSRLTSTPTLDSSWKTARTGDFNGDGKSDILWRNDNGAVAIWQMNGANVLASTLTSTPTLDSSWKTAGTGDFDGDGKSDILWRNDDGTVALWQMNGFTAVSSLTSNQHDGSWQINGTGDFNGDGKADILWRNTTTSAVEIWQMNGASVISSAVVGTQASSWVADGTGDFNGDGKADILWRNTSGVGEVQLWQVNGFAVNASLTSIPPDNTNWKIAAPII